MVTKSFQLLRTNPLLTTNIKLVVSSNYKLYLESFDTNKQLSDTKYKHVIINKDTLLESYIPVYYKDLPVNIAYDVKYDNDNNIMYNNYDNQFDDIYYAGAKNIDDQWYNEEFEYFAPLYTKKNYLPSNFIILRVDDPTVYNILGDKITIGNLNKDNFRNEIIDKWKCVSLFDLSKNTDLGIFLNNNINNNDRYPEKSFELDIKKYNFSRWYGIDYISGVYTEKSMILDDKLYYENPDFNLEKYITTGFRDNKIVYPHILNLKFLFDDTPATPVALKKWSMNRYLGFYIDELQLKNNLTSYVTPKLKNNIKLVNNIFIKNGTDDENICPFVNGWDDNIKYFIYVDNDFHAVEKIYESVDYIYKIVSTKKLDDIFDVNTVYNNTITITYDDITGKNVILPYDGGELFIDDYIDSTLKKDSMDGDLYLININGNYHILKNKKTVNLTGYTHQYYIQTDYAINSNSDYIEYWINNKDSEYYKKIQIFDKNNKPLMYPIYKVKFTDIKDFDYDRVNTHFSDFDYEKTYYYKTKETKLYTTEYRDINDPQIDKVHAKGENGQYNIMNVSSEYITSNELFEIKNNDLSDIWRKNQSVCKWGYQGSISHSDYPYKLNNNQNTGYEFNRTVNPFMVDPNIQAKNLEYFYRVGNFYGLNENAYFYNQSTNITNNLKFNINDYLNNKYDVFSYFFNQVDYFSEYGKTYIKQYEKYSVLNNGSNLEFSTTVFKGLKINVQHINNFILSSTDNKIQDILTTKNINYNNYKFTILLNERLRYYDTNYDETSYNHSAIQNYSILFPNITGETKNSIHIFLNEKYKNILVLININTQLSSNVSSISTNDITVFGENNYLYTGTTLNGGESYTGYSGSDKYNPRILTAYNFINAINDMNNKHSFDDYITFHYIDSNDNIGHLTLTNYNSSTMYNISNWNKKETPFIINIETPNLLELKKYSYYYDPIQGPDYNIYDKFKVLTSDKLLKSANIDDYLARNITINEADLTPRNIRNGETIDYTDEIYRFSGSYEPIFKNIELFNCYKTWIDNQNNIVIQDNNIFFNTNLKRFGKIEEIIYSKVNTKENLLKLKDVENDKSIYPMVDEYGYSFTDRFIFKSNWDSEFYIKSSISQQEELISGELVVQIYFISGITSGLNSVINNKLNVTYRNTGTISRTGAIYYLWKSPSGTTFDYLPFTQPSVIIAGNSTYEYTTPEFNISGFGEHQFSTRFNDSVVEIAFAQYQLIPLPPIADFLPMSSGVTEGDFIQFTYVQTVGAGEPDTYKWTFEGGYPTESTLQNPIVLYNNFVNSPYTVILEVENANSSDKITRYGIINVQEKILPPIADFYITDNPHPLALPITTAYTKDTLYLHYNGTGGVPTYYKWSMPTGIPVEEVSYVETTPTVTFASAGLKTITLEVSNEDGLGAGGSSTKSHNISMTVYIDPDIPTYTAPLPRIKVSPQAGQLENGYITTTPITFSDNSIEGSLGYHNIVGWYWQKAGSTWTSVGSNFSFTKTFNTTGTYTIKLIISDGVTTNAFITTQVTINSSSSTPGCLSINTPIPMFDGTWKRLGNLKVGDELKTFKIKNFNIDENNNDWRNWNTNIIDVNIDKTFVKYIKFIQAPYYYEINSDIKVASGHPFFIKKYNENMWKWVNVENIDVNDKMLDMYKNEIIVTSKNMINIPLEVAILDTENLDYYFANGIFIHNKPIYPNEV